MKTALAATLTAICLPAFGQLPAPGQSGVTMGHLHFNASDLDASRKFWLALGGTPAKLGSMEFIKFPDVLVFMRKAEPGGGSEASVVNHIGFRVRSLEECAAKWKAAGLTILPGAGPTRSSSPRPTV